MAFFYFAPNAFSMIQNLQMSQTYETQLSSMTSSLNQPFYEIFPWNQYVPTEIFSIPQKELSIYQLPTNDNHYESEVKIALDRKKNIKQEKKTKGQQKQVSSAKKNSQSNIINQFFSYFGSKQKSEQLALRIIKVVLPESENYEKILDLLYNTFQAINIQRGRKYVNKNVLLNYFTPQVMIENLPRIQEKIEAFDYVTLDDLCQIFRRCCHSFLRSISTNAILTSKRIVGISKEQHLKKRRKIVKTILDY